MENKVPRNSNRRESSRNEDCETDDQAAPTAPVNKPSAETVNEPAQEEAQNVPEVGGATPAEK